MKSEFRTWNHCRDVKAAFTIDYTEQKTGGGGVFHPPPGKSSKESQISPNSDIMNNFDAIKFSSVMLPNH